MTDRGSLGVHFPKAAMTDLNSSPPRKSLRGPNSVAVGLAQRVPEKGLRFDVDERNRM